MLLRCLPALLLAAACFAEALADVPASVRKRRAAVSRVIAATPPGVAKTNAMVSLRRSDFALAEYPSVEPVTRFAERELLLAVQAATGDAPVSGARVEGYHSALDDSLQPFWRYIPEGLPKDDQDMPLMVYLHGYFPDMDIVNWTLIPSNLTATADALGFAVAAPFARGNTDFQGVGEADVLRVIDEMCARYPVDEDRIILVGFSMGGMGAYGLAAHDPARFAGALIVAGRGSYYFWHQRQRSAEPAYRRYMIDADFGHSLLSNLEELPFMIGHGALDLGVPVVEGRYMARALRRVNENVIYVEEADGDHFAFDTLLGRDDIRAWLRGQRRDAERAQPVSAFDAERGRYRWRAAGEQQAEAVPSPFKQAHLAPFLYVNAAGRRDRIFRTAVKDWTAFAHGPPRMADAASVTPEQLRTHNIFLFGPAAGGELIEQVLAGSPVGIQGEHFVAGEHRVASDERGLIVVRQSPWNPERLAVVSVGAAWGTGLPSNHKYDFIPDFIIFDAWDYEWDGANRARCAGFFDADWQIDPEFLHVAEDEELDTLPEPDGEAE